MQSFITRLQEKFGRPVTLQRLLADSSEVRLSLDEPQRVISLESVVRWNDWGQSSESMCVWRGRDEQFGIIVPKPKIALGRVVIRKDWKFEIQDVVGFANSQSDLNKFVSLDDMVESDSPEMIAAMTDEAVEKNLAHREIRLLNQADTSDHVARYAWDGRLFLISAGGSHHFSAARYIAARIGRTVPIKATLHAYSLEPAAVRSLQDRFDIYAVPGQGPFFPAFEKAVRSYGASYFWIALPRPYKDAFTILLPKSLPRAARVSAELRLAGALDLGEHLARLAKQS
jgi:hypothetical protein